VSNDVTWESRLRPEILTPLIRRAAHDGMELAVEHLLTEANTTVPIDEGTLLRSGSTGVEDKPDGVTGTVSYDTPYAVKQHEDTALAHDGQGRSKWLELALAEQKDTMGQILGRAIREGIHG
jgi:hypothetical protein